MSTLITCPECHQTEQSSQSIGVGVFVRHSPARVGDFSICAHCGVLLRFGNEWRRATAEEIQALPYELRVIVGRLRLSIELYRANREH